MRIRKLRKIKKTTIAPPRKINQEIIDENPFATTSGVRMFRYRSPLGKLHVDFIFQFPNVPPCKENIDVIASIHADTRIWNCKVTNFGILR